MMNLFIMYKTGDCVVNYVVKRLRYISINRQVNLDSEKCTFLIRHYETGFGNRDRGTFPFFDLHTF